MARSRLSYTEAVRLLLGGEDPVTILGRVAGGAMLIAAPFAEGVLSWFDYKGEANNVLRDLLGRAPARIRARRGRRHYELLEAAHTVLVLSAYFDAVAEHVGDRFAALELTDEERRRIGAGELKPLGGHNAVPMPDAMTGFNENLPTVTQSLYRMQAAFCDFASGLAAGQGITMPVSSVIVEHAVHLYQERYVRLAADIPEFAIWSQLDEHAATRAEVRRQTETLTGVTEMLGRLVAGSAPAAVAGLARHYEAALHRPLWRSEAPAPEGVAFPSVEDGFVSPGFRLARCEKGQPLSDESWWSRHPVRDDLGEFLAGYLAAPESTQRPLIVLGDPGAGKSLLTEVLAARIPHTAYTTIRVPLRRVDPDAPIHHQIVAAVELATKEQLSWGELCRGSDTTKVVLLDGFDEFVQATGVIQSHYVEQAAAFQQEEWVQERPVITVITSRTLVMDRTVVREGTAVLKLEPFDEGRVKRWTAAWNTANHGQTYFRPLTPAALWRHADLAGQPLLLLMLAVHAAASPGGLDDDDLTTDLLYRRLLDDFIRRQVREKVGIDLGETKFAQLEAASRRDLAAVAFAMFNRRRQWIGEADLGLDLEALDPKDSQELRAGEPVSRARRTVAAFFFVHVARADEEDGIQDRRSYEFLHATFGEYLVAEHTVQLLTELAEDWRRAQSRTYQANLDDRVLRAMLSHQPLSNGEQILPFLRRIVAACPAPEREALFDVVLELFRTARRRIADHPYRPTSFDAVNRLAAYTANLALLAGICRSSEGVAVDELCGPGAADIASTVRLWRSGLDAEVQEGFFSWLQRREDRLAVERRAWYKSLESQEADLLGDGLIGAVLGAGWATLENDEGLEVELSQRATAYQRDFHIRVVQLLVWGLPCPGLPRLHPDDEGRYARLADWLDRYPCGNPWAGTLNVLVDCLLRDAAHIDKAIVDRLIARFNDEWLTSLEEVGLRIAILALSHPDMMRRNSWLRNAVLRPGLPVAYLYEVARGCLHRDPKQLGRILALLDEQIALIARQETGVALPVPSMIVGLRSHPTLIPEILQGLILSERGDLTAAQIAPGDLLHSLGPAKTWDERTALLVAQYVADRQQDVFEGEETSAFQYLIDATDGLPTH